MPSIIALAITIIASAQGVGTPAILPIDEIATKEQGISSITYLVFKDV
ncbi:hypothetical protein SDC9_191765 [bioreactor metagenome]|uniref:Uncharacterized protein n=1 Tax=bioreactor metagenome TaxID=1076179 RepID=A0A645I723_9ZZZZ